MDTSTRLGPVTADDLPRMRADLAGLVAEQAIIAAAQARAIRHQAALVDMAWEQIARASSRASREREIPMRSLSAEVACALHVHDLTAQRELNEAWGLVTKLSATVDALEAARITRRHAAVIHQVGVEIDDDDVRGAWEAVVLDRAERDTPGRTKAFAIQLAEKVNPVGMTERFEQANEHRSISVLDLDDGMAMLQVLLPATLAHGIRDRIAQQARLIHTDAAAERARRAAAADAAAADGAPPPAEGDVNASRNGASASDDALLPADDAPVFDDTRTIRQISADLVADMLLTGTPGIDPTADRSPGGLGAIRAHVQIVIPVTTLTGTTDRGATLDGAIPIDPATARRLAGDAPGWDRVMCDPVTGTVLDVDRYTPLAEQKRFLQARDQHCRAFGCRRPAHRCQIDHNHEHHEGGPTSLNNLAHLCQRHHTVKTETDWTVTQLPDGTLHFTSPLGNTYRDEPPPRVMFVPDGDPPPF